MTNEEALKNLKYIKDAFEYEYHIDYQIAFGIALEALEKQIPKKPYKISMVEYECPDCHKTLVYKYPCKCGQMIDWSEVYG